MRELDQRAMELANAEEECRRAINVATKDYNKALVSEPDRLYYVTINYRSITPVWLVFSCMAKFGRLVRENKKARPNPLNLLLRTTTENISLEGC